MDIEFIDQDKVQHLFPELVVDRAPTILTSLARTASIFIRFPVPLPAP